MRFLVDRCAGRRLATWLRDQGHDILESPALGPDPGDVTLLEIASGDARILITIDTDFGRLIFRDGLTHHGIVRLPDVPAAQRIEIMRQVLERHAAQLDAGAVVTVRGSRIRVSIR